ncbi:velvet factor-domain-containing protein [Mycena floridula]|nr:velvet factor-domain-containing protein [Mycena floridula]
MSHQSVGPSIVGLPVHFLSGQFTGQTIRAELTELQKANLGRKYARIDRRPLDPPPVVALRLFQVHNPGTDHQTEQEIPTYDETQLLGFVCTVDLFPVRLPDDERELKPRKTPSHPLYQTSQQQFTFMSTSRYSQRTVPFPSNPPNAEIIHQIKEYPITEDSKRTNDLVGATFVQPSLIDWEGKKSLMFVFSDLAVKTEGNFILRYRVFDLFSKPSGHPNFTIQAETYGGLFRVYSTKEFPGLQASTELTKHISRYGVRLNIRETERKRRKNGKKDGPSVNQGKRKHSRDREEDRESEEEE